MIEVLFGESEAESMKTAKCENTAVIRCNGPTSYIGRPSKMDKTGGCWIPGNGSEVVCLGFCLDIGDIRQDVDSDYRKNLIWSLYRQSPGEDDREEISQMKMAGTQYAEELKRLIALAQKGESLRIWYSSAPYSLCGFYHVCSLLVKFPCKVSIVPLPEYMVRENCIQMYRNWGEVAAEEFAGFLQYEKPLSENELRMYAHRWTDLVEENMPLRACINGWLTGVEENFYDDWIRKEITLKPEKEARIIGQLIGKYQLGIGDGWYALRIDRMIEKKEIAVAADSSNKYARMIRKVRLH